MTAISRRLAAAAVLVVVCLGLAWGSTPGVGILIPTFTTYVPDISGGLDLRISPGYLGGGPSSVVLGYESEQRVLLVPAALLLGWAAAHPARAVRPARAGLVLVVVLGLLAGRQGLVAPLLCLTGAAALVAPLVRRTGTARPRTVQG